MIIPLDMQISQPHSCNLLISLMLLFPICCVFCEYIVKFSFQLSVGGEDGGENRLIPLNDFSEVGTGSSLSDLNDR